MHSHNSCSEHSQTYMLQDMLWKRREINQINAIPLLLRYSLGPSLLSQFSKRKYAFATAQLRFRILAESFQGPFWSSFPPKQQLRSSVTNNNRRTAEKAPSFSSACRINCMCQGLYWPWSDSLSTAIPQLFHGNSQFVSINYIWTVL